MKKAACIFLILGLFTFTIACKKGSRKSTEELLTSTKWKLIKYGNKSLDDADLSFKDYEEEYTDDGDYIRAYTNEDGDRITEKGFWTYLDRNDEIRIQGNGINPIKISDEHGKVSTSTYYIVKIAGNAEEFIYEFKDCGGCKRHKFTLEGK